MPRTPGLSEQHWILIHNGTSYNTYQRLWNGGTEILND